MTDASKYTGLITSQHANKPKFMAMVDGVAQPFVDLQAVLANIPASYDLDNAIGDQLDVVGEWVGIGRNISTPLSVYFSLDTSGLGFDQGSWQGPYDPSTGLISLDDDTYRLLIRAKIGANSWDGTLGTSAAILNSIFGSSESLQPSGIVASGESFGTGDGLTKSFQLQYQGRPIFQISGSPSLYRNDWQGNQLLYSTPRTNMLRQSSFQTGWSLGGSGTTSLTPNYGTAPDGTLTAAVLSTLPGGSQYIYQSQTWAAGNSYTISAYAKTLGCSTFAIQSFQQSGAATFNIATGVATGFNGVCTGQAITPLIPSNGWYRCSATFQSNASGSNNIGFGTYGSSYSGNGFLIWGGQCELGPLTPLIPTLNSAVSVTDYTISTTGLVSLSSAPLSASALSWSGNGAIYPNDTFAFMQDNGDMSITVGVAGKTPSAVFMALLSHGYIPLKPSTVHVNAYLKSSVSGTPLFGFDVENQYISGFDVGSLGIAA